MNDILEAVRAKTAKQMTNGGAVRAISAREEAR